MTDQRTHALGTILSVWAHPDDETYLAGGLMAAAAAQGQRVVCVSATAGEHGTSDPAAWPPERLGPLRESEAASAMTALGVAEHRFLGLPDGRLADHDEDGTTRVGELIDEVQPDTILTFGPTGTTFHPDHIAVHRWVTAAWERRGRPGRLLYATTTASRLGQLRQSFEQLGIYMTDERPVGVPASAVAVDVQLDDREVERKLTALRAMPSQTDGLFATLDAPMIARLLREETFEEARSWVPAQAS